MVAYIDPGHRLKMVASLKTVAYIDTPILYTLYFVITVFGLVHIFSEIITVEDRKKVKPHSPFARDIVKGAITPERVSNFCYNFFLVMVQISLFQNEKRVHWGRGSEGFDSWPPD